MFVSGYLAFIVLLFLPGFLCYRFLGDSLFLWVPVPIISYRDKIPGAIQQVLRGDIAPFQRGGRTAGKDGKRFFFESF